jgi:replicative DNA helicase
MMANDELNHLLKSTTLDQEDKQPLPFSVERLDLESANLPPGRPSGWQAVNDLDVKFHAGELAIIAGRTGHGKTSTLVSLLTNWLKKEAAASQGIFLFYSAEEPEVRIYHRILSILSADTKAGWSANEIRDYMQDPRQRSDWPDPAGLDQARRTMQTWEGHLMVVYRPQWTVDDVLVHARRVSRVRPVSAILVDYLQRLPVPDELQGQRRDLQISFAARRLKMLAVELFTPVVTAAQVSRDSIPEDYWQNLRLANTFEAARTAIRLSRPTLDHLQDGGFEQEADLVLGLLNYAADYTDISIRDRTAAPSMPLEIGTLKNRYGIPGQWASLAFLGRHGLIRDPELRRAGLYRQGA